MTPERIANTAARNCPRRGVITLSEGRRSMEILYYSRTSSPAGPLLIGVSDTALVALEFDSRAAGKDRGAADPVGRICRAHSRRVRTIAGVLLRQTSQLRPHARLARNRFPEALLERTASNSLRRNTFVCRDRASCRQSEELSRRWTGEPLQSDRDHRSLPPRPRRRLLSGRIRRRTSGQSLFAAAGRCSIPPTRRSARSNRATGVQRELNSISGVASSSVRV